MEYSISRDVMLSIEVGELAGAG